MDTSVQPPPRAAFRKHRTDCFQTSRFTKCLQVFRVVILAFILRRVYCPGAFSVTDRFLEKTHAQFAAMYIFVSLIGVAGWLRGSKRLSGRHECHLTMFIARQSRLHDSV